MLDGPLTQEISRIRDSLASGVDELPSFTRYLAELESLGDFPFTSATWPFAWRRAVMEFAKLFTKMDASSFLLAMTPYTNNVSIRETIAFVYSEILWNYYEQASPYNRDLLKDFIKQFPYNPEFHNTYGLFLLANKNYEKALYEHQRALNIEINNINFLDCYYICVKEFFEHLIENRKIDDAENFVDGTIKYLFEKDLNNVAPHAADVRSRVFFMKDRLKDHKVIANQIVHFQKDIENTIRVEQRRLIEVLGIFSAIIAFILTNISIGITNLPIKEMLVLMFGMAVTLIIFATAISFFFGPRLRYPPKFHFLYRPKFWSLIAMILLLLGLLKYSS
jgi:hypothetical protein